MKPYSYSMGILALLVAGTTAKSLTDSVNRSMEKPIKSTICQHFWQQLLVC